MLKATIKSRNLEVFIRGDISKPVMAYNYGKVAVSKQPTGVCIFYVDETDLEVIK
jgi:hypothetical protein